MAAASSTTSSNTPPMRSQSAPTGPSRGAGRLAARIGRLRRTRTAQALPIFGVVSVRSWGEPLTSQRSGIPTPPAVWTFRSARRQHGVCCGDRPVRSVASRLPTPTGLESPRLAAPTTRACRVRGTSCATCACTGWCCPSPPQISPPTGSPGGRCLPVSFNRTVINRCHPWFRQPLPPEDDLAAICRLRIQPYSTAHVWYRHARCQTDGECSRSES